MINNRVERSLLDLPLRTWMRDENTDVFFDEKERVLSVYKAGLTKLEISEVWGVHIDCANKFIDEWSNEL